MKDSNEILYALIIHIDKAIHSTSVSVKDDKTIRLDLKNPQQKRCATIKHGVYRSIRKAHILQINQKNIKQNYCSFIYQLTDLLIMSVNEAATNTRLIAVTLTTLFKMTYKPLSENVYSGFLKRF